MRPFEQLVRSAIQDGAVRTVENIKRLVESGKSATAVLTLTDYSLLATFRECDLRLEQENLFMLNIVADG